MKLRNYINIFIASITIVVTGCVEPYSPPESSKTIDILVVDGFLDSNSGTVNVKLSKAVTLASTEAPPAVTNAIVTLEDSDNNVTALQTTDASGMYSIDGLALNASNQYRIRIKTGGKEYLSDFITPKTSPPIDSVTWEGTEDGVRIMVNTHDATGDSKYYLWTFDETYEYRSTYTSSFKIVEGEVFLRQPEEQIGTCWKTLNSKRILIGSSLRLDEDIISKKEIQFIPKGDIRTSVRYSILVKQVVLSREAYDFWENLRKTTEQLGGLFDPQPGQVLGNIRRIDESSEPVLGYFDGGQVVEKRIFIGFYELPRFLRVSQPNNGCELDTLLVENLPIFNPADGFLVSQIYEGPALIAYTFTTRSCADCRVKSGSTSKPSFWP
jgi:hypothetical protein